MGRSRKKRERLERASGQKRGVWIYSGTGKLGEKSTDGCHRKGGIAGRSPGKKIAAVEGPEKEGGIRQPSGTAEVKRT